MTKLYQKTPSSNPALHDLTSGAIDTRAVIMDVWTCMRTEASKESKREPILASHLHAAILNHGRFSEALSFHLSTLLDSGTLAAIALREVTEQAYNDEPELVAAAACDMAAIRDRDSACHECGTPFLYFKGFHALQTYRLANYLWRNSRKELASYLQSACSIKFGVDIHPAAVIGHSIMLDHATGIVIGETSTVGNHVSIMQSVTLGGTGKSAGDRHPKVGSGVLIGAGSRILGNIKIGDGAQVCAGSVVLDPVPAQTVVAGVPAKEIGKIDDPMPALTMNHAPPQMSD